MATSRALVVPRNGDSSVLEVQDREVSPPGEGEVQVEVAAVGVNFIDVYQRQGSTRSRRRSCPAPRAPARGDRRGRGRRRTSRSATGWPGAPGSAPAARWSTATADSLVPVPDGVELDVAAAAMLQGMTAHYLVNSHVCRGAGDRGAGPRGSRWGRASCSCRWSRPRAARVVATAGSADKLEIARGLGADAVINYRESADLAAEVRAANGGNGVDVAYDGVGKATFDASLASLRPRGMMVLFGGASGQVPPFDIQRLNAQGSLFLTRPTLGSYTATREELLERGTLRARRHRGGAAEDRDRRTLPARVTRPRHTTTWKPAAPPASCCPLIPQG